MESHTHKYLTTLLQVFLPIATDGTTGGWFMIPYPVRVRWLQRENYSDREKVELAHAIFSTNEWQLMKSD